MKAASFLTVCGQEITPERERKLQEELNSKTYSMLLGYINCKKAHFASTPKEEITALAEMPMDSIVNGKDIFQKLIAPYRGRAPMRLPFKSAGPAIAASSRTIITWSACT